MQRFYGLNLSDMGTAYTVAHAACLIEYVPDGSAVMAEFEPCAAYTIDQHYLHLIAEAALRKPIPYPWGGRNDDGGNELGELASIPSDKIHDYFFKTEWTEVEDGKKRICDCDSVLPADTEA